VSNYLAGIFGSSPIEPLQAHMDTCHAAVRGLVTLFEAAARDDWDAASGALKLISIKEREADELKHSIRRQLSRNLMMPVPREDLLDLVQTQDKVANLSKKTARMVLWRKLRLPDEIKEPFLALLERTAAASKKARKSIRELDELYETGFRGAEAERVGNIISQIEEIESETDRMQGSLRENLLAIEDSMPPVQAMFLYRAVDLIGEIADSAERVGRRLDGLLRL
jgi:predicted phosphate transport protein (TIGR00153 family)